MNYNYIVEQLKKYKILKAEIKVIELDIEELHESDNIGCSGVSYEEHTGATNKFSSITENEAIKLIDSTATLERDKRSKERELERIENALSILDQKEREVLELKHICGYGWNKVTTKMDRSYSHCKAIENEALKKIVPFMRC